MDALARPIIPPAPYVHPEDLSTPRLVVATLSNTLGNWSKNAFDIPYGRRKVLGVDSLLVIDPAAIREVMQTGMSHYGRPLAAEVDSARAVASRGAIEGRRCPGRRRPWRLTSAAVPCSPQLLCPLAFPSLGSRPSPWPRRSPYRRMQG